MKKKIAAVLIALGALGAFAACHNQGATPAGTSDYKPQNTTSFYQQTPEGKVLCVWAKSGYGGGLSCDWNHVE